MLHLPVINYQLNCQSRDLLWLTWSFDSIPVVFCWFCASPSCLLVIYRTLSPPFHFISRLFTTYRSDYLSSDLDQPGDKSNLSGREMSHCKGGLRYLIATYKSNLLLGVHFSSSDISKKSILNKLRVSVEEVSVTVHITSCNPTGFAYE